MLYYSTNGRSNPASLKEAVVRGLAPDGGLYMPASLPVIPASFFGSMHSKSLQEISLYVAEKFLSDDIPSDVLKDIVYETLDFPVPVIEVEPGIYSLELFHGPTMAFKDVGARFMSRLMSYLYSNEERALNVIVATSGDTGSAVASGFYGVEGINVFVLFPKGKVSSLQQKQITTYGENIFAVEVDGSFDDCQKLAKDILGDTNLNKTLSLTSANSINIGRLIPQSFYYYHSYARVIESAGEVVFSVPSGNFGNLTAGIMAKFSGLPVKKFVASTNINDVFPTYLRTGKYQAMPSKTTISNAMDVGNPSNFARISEIMHKSIDCFRENLVSYSFSDSDTLGAIESLFSDTGYVMDPHGAVAYLGLKRYLSESNISAAGLFLETAHPAKFAETVNRVIKGYDCVPPQLKSVIEKEESYLSIKNCASEFKELLIGNC